MKTILILAAAAVAFSASPALAQNAAGSSQLVVSSAGLDLTTAGGVARLDRRIRTAVEIACGPTSDSDLHGKNVVRQCRIDTLALARAQRDTAIAAASGASPIQVASAR
jgi:UrcA family protein